MAIGIHDCQTARDVDLKGAILIGLDEALTALAESFADLTDEQVGRFPMPERNNIAWIVMHCLESLHEYAVGCASHFSPSVEPERLWADEPQWNHWEGSPDGWPKPVLADWYMRTICHTISHTRQIWALRGMMGLVDTERAWPRQHWA